MPLGSHSDLAAFSMDNDDAMTGDSTGTAHTEHHVGHTGTCWGWTSGFWRVLAQGL